MALVPWREEDEENKDDLGFTPIKQIASVQSGAWQPAPSGADSPQMLGDDQQPQQQPSQDMTETNYLFSEEKAQVDAQKAQRDAQIAEARRQDAIRRQAAAELQAQQKAADEQKAQQQQQPKQYKPKNAGEAAGDFFQGLAKGLWKGGAGALGSLSSTVSSLITGDADNDVTEATKRWQKSADDWGNEVHADGVGDFIGNIPGGVISGIVDPANYFVRGVRNTPEMIAANIASMSGDKYTRQAGIDMQKEIQARQFGDDVAKNGDGAMLMEAIAKPGAMILNVATAGGGSVATQVPKQAYQQIMKTAAKEGVVNVAAGVPISVLEQAARDYDITLDSVTKDALLQGVTGATIGGISQGRAISKNRNGMRESANLPQEEFTPVERAVEEADVRPAELEDGNISFERQDITPVEAPVADGVVTPDTPDMPDYSPIAEGTPSAADMPTLADGQVTTMPAEVTPVRESVIEAPADVTPAVTPEVPTAAADVTPVADGTVQPVRDENITPVGTEEVRALQESRAGKSQADEAIINQQLREAENATPTENLPDDVTPVDGAVNTDTGVPLTRQQVAERLMPKLADNKDVKQQIADAAGMSKDVESPIRDILKEGNVKPRQAERVATRFEKLEKQLQDYNRLEEMNQKAYAEGGTAALDENVSRERSRVAREMGTTTRRLMQDIRRMEGSRDFKTRLINNVTDAIGTRNASVLSSAGLLERNMMQELTANLKLAAKNPVQMARSTFQNGNIIKDTVKSELSHWGDLPSATKPVEIVKYVVGNTYRTGMIPTTALANTRRGAVRDEFTKWAFQELEGRNVSTKEAHKLAGTAGNELEALVNTFTGVDNGMTNRGQAMEAMKAWKEYIRTGDDGAKAEFMSKVEQHNSLADQMIAGMSKEDQTRARGLMAMKNLIFPFVRTATNLMKNTVRQDLNPFAKSLLDEIRADQRSGGANAVNLIKSKLVDYGIMGGAAALASSGAIVYNDGDEVDKPKGWSLQIGDNEYIPVRATSLELPIAMAGAAQAMFNDIQEGNSRDWKYYAGMVTGSLPYIDQFNTTTGAVDSLMSGEDAGYAAKAYGVNMAKGFVPFSNNGIQAYTAGKAGESLNAKSVYDDNMMTWFTNTVRKSYDPEFYNSLKDSRDNAGRVRTVDNQGVISNKDINDAGTAEFNDRITDLVNFGRENGMGEKVQDMFNTYDTGKNNNFKSIQDAITFLDVEDGGKPDNTKKLEKNGKLTDLAQQMRDGFFGESGSELLTLDGQNLKSDASVPNGAGSKNSKLPMSMQSIKNAIAQTDIPKEDSDKLYELSNQSTELYGRLKAKEISYEQYSAAKAQLGQQEIDILSNSENYKKMEALFDELDESGFFEADGLGSTKSGQTYLWNSLNALLGSKGATPAANYPESGRGFTPWGNRGTGRSSTSGAKNEGMEGLRWTPVGKRQMAAVQSGRYTPVNTKVKLGNAIKKDRSQNYSDRSF